MAGRLQTAQHFHVSNILPYSYPWSTVYNETLCHLFASTTKHCGQEYKQTGPQLKRISATVENTSVGYGGTKPARGGRDATVFEKTGMVARPRPWVNHRALSHFWVFLSTSTLWLFPISTQTRNLPHKTKMSLVSPFQLK